MSTQPKDGGPAFPRPGFTTDRKMPHLNASEGGFANVEQQGMTLRDWFAGQVLAAMTAASDYTKGPCNAEMAERAFRIADHMIAAREKGPTT